MKDLAANDVAKFLNSLYDAMIVWNIKGGRDPLRLHLGMTPQDYIAFMQDPESWAVSYVSNLYSKRSAVQKE